MSASALRCAVISLCCLMHVVQVQAQARQTDADVLEEVIVTAQKRTQRLIDTPISVGVLSGQALDQSSARGVADALNQVGGVSVSETRPGDVQIVVRGVLSGRATGTSATAYYMDEVPVAFINTASLPDSNAFDLARVEVLRGPQGTLYGANALAGVVRVLSNDADVSALEIKGRARVSRTHGHGDNDAGDLVVNVPVISGKLAMRGVASYSDHGGFISSALDGGSDINDVREQSYRLKANYQPTDDLGIRLGVAHSAIDAGAPSHAQDSFTTRFASNQYDERDTNLYNLVAEYQWSGFSLLSSTGYVDYTYGGVTDLLLAGTTRLPAFLGGNLDSFSEEVRLSSHLDGPWRWSAGIFYKDTTEKVRQDPLLSFIPGILNLQFDSESHAVFGDVTRAFINGRVELTGGLRYFEDRFAATQFSGFFPGPAIQPQQDTFDKLTWRALLGFRPRRNAMLYGSVATGFRSGRNQSFSALAFDPTLPTITPDSLITYELGTKGRRLGGTFSYETAIYYTVWDDIQQSLIIPAGFNGYLNAGKASGLGLDASIALQPSDSLSFNLSVGWNDLRLDENVRSGTVTLFEKGARINDSPEWTGSVGVGYRTETPWPEFDLVMTGNLAYGSTRLLRYQTGAVVDQTQSDAVTLLKASVALDNGRWQVGVYGDNLLNEDGSVTPPASTDAFNSIRYRPRTLGLQATFQY